MVAHHAPHTPPQWRRVISLPQTGIGWLAIGLASPALLFLGLQVGVEFLGWTLPWLNMDQPDANPIVGTLLAIAAVTGLFGAAMAAVALAGGHEQSWLVWLALLPLLIAFSMWIGLLTSLVSATEIVAFGLAFLIVVSIVAVIAFWIARVNARQSR